MPNHFHLVAWPRRDGDLSRWMQWLMTSHVRRYHRYYDSSGHVWQGRFKAFPIQSDGHLLTVMRYVERNPVRAKTVPVRKAQNWLWSSAGNPPTKFPPVKLHGGPVLRRRNWLDWVNQPPGEAELDAMKVCISRGRPYGEELWQKRIVKRLGLESTMRPRGPPEEVQKVQCPLCPVSPLFKPHVDGDRIAFDDNWKHCSNFEFGIATQPIGQSVV